VVEKGMEMVRDEKNNLKKADSWNPYGWIEEGLKKRRSNFSNIICFETKDPQRYEQLLEYLPQCEYRKDSTFFSYDPWNGLMKGKFDPRSGKLKCDPYRRDVGGGYAAVPEEVKSLVEALREMDRFLKSYKTTFLIRNIEGRADQEKVVLGDAFKDWALDKHIMEKGSLIVLCTTDLSSILDESTSSLIAFITPPLSTEDERREIIRDLERKLELRNKKEDQESLVLATSGLNLHQVRCVLLESYNKYKTFRRQEIKKLKAEFIRRTDLVEVREPEDIICQGCGHENLPSDKMQCERCGRPLEQRRGFASIGGYQKVKDFAKNHILKALENPQGFNKPPRGILLFGPPGTGKSTFASALAEVAHVPFINLRTENLYSPWLGVSGQRFRDAIRLVEQMSPAICFIDEIDRFGMRTSGELGSGGGGEETRRVFNQVLEWLGDKQRKAIIVGATNRPQDLDEAFKRPGRIDYKIPFLYPDKEARKEIIKVHLGDIKCQLNTDLNDLLEELSQKTLCFTGAEIEQLILRAKRRAVKEERYNFLTDEDFKHALNSFRINWANRLYDLSKYIEQAKEECDDQELLQELLPEELEEFLKAALNRLEEKGEQGFSLEGLPLF
jgi:SpoVK/Ycf46/Vps4 family AAA+-type ATPase